MKTSKYLGKHFTTLGIFTLITFIVEMVVIYN